ncbi:MAG: transglycosylase domain-containing protein [Dehalococcoidia bacterium]|nr:transglycosylase domain-containing protein [Dehalococcoidia bacterium]
MSASRTAILRRRRRRFDHRNEGSSTRKRMLIALAAIVGFFVISIGLVAGGTGLYAVSRYDEIAEGVVPPEQLIAEQSRGGARILDRNGEFLYEFVDELSGLRRPVSLQNMSQWLIDATVAVEDPTFYENNGLNTRGLIRAGVENFAPFLMGDEGQFLEGSGGSSITQQLAKNIYIPREERTNRSVDRKIKEMVIALELTKKYEKDQILEWYLNSIPYGGIYTGIEAAAQGYFDKSAAELTLPEAALLAGIPQSPARYDPFSAENLDEETGQLSATSLAKARQAEVLKLMVEDGVITQQQADEALDAPLQFRQARFEIEAPHFVLGRIAAEIAERFGERALYDQGLTVTTTLDLNLQHMGEEIVEQYVTEYGEQANLFNGAFVAINPRNGEILTYVGSRDYFRDDIEGRNDMAAAANSPGSTLKPFAFMTAFMNGWGTGTGVIAAPFEIMDYSTGSSFSPRDPIAQVLGPITAAQALGNSLNTTAIKTIMSAGVQETIQTLKRVGYTTFDNPAGYGPALITGGSEITLLDEVYAYSVLASGGIMRGTDVMTTPNLDPGERTLEPAAILEVVDSEGRVLLDYEPVEQRVVAEPYTYLVTSILSDGSNQCITYGVCGALALPNGYPSAAKTGTSEPFEDSRDIGETWTVGYTPELAGGVWAGNADNSRIQGITSTSVSLRAWKDFMVQALEYLEAPATSFTRPDGVVSREVCWPSGKLPTDACPELKRYTSLYAAEVLPSGPEGLSEEEVARLYDTWWKKVAVDTRTGLIAASNTPSQFVNESVRLVLPEDEVKGWSGVYAWAAANGVSGMLGATTPASAGSELPARIDSPSANSVLDGNVTIRGRATSENFTQYRLEYGRGDNPSSWIRISSSDKKVSGGSLGRWDTGNLSNGEYTLRLVVEDETLGARYYQIPVRIGDSGQGDDDDDDGDNPPTGQDAPVVSISSPAAGSLVSGTIAIVGTAASQAMEGYEVQYGLGVTPSSWTTVGSGTNPIAGGTLASLDTTQVSDGPYTIRIVLRDVEYGSVTSEVLVVIRNQGGG